MSYADFNAMNFFEIINIIQVYDENMKEQQKHQEKENAKMEKQMSQMQNKFNYNQQ